MTALLVRVDGELMPEEAARSFWERFSAHMEANKGDLAGFAAKEGFASVRPGMENGRPVLLVSKTGAQTPYAPVREGEGGGGGGGGKRQGKKKRR